MSKVLVLGSRGLLGSAVYARLKENQSFKVIGSSSQTEDSLLKFDVSTDDLFEFLRPLEPTHIVNCIGKIPQKSSDLRAIDRFRAMASLNTIFPRKLSQWTTKNEVSLIQIQTDCVFRGQRGNYDEGSIRCSTDAYGISKILGERKGASQFNIRTSIVGQNSKDSSSLFGWFQNLPSNSKINGYTNHFWNGVTTNTFAKLTEGLINSGRHSSLNVHFVPKNSLTKYEMLEIFKEISGRNDVTITPVAAPRTIDRRLSTQNPELNEELWSLARFNSVPDVRDLLTQTLN